MSGTFRRSDVRLGNWRASPWNRWAFQNVREIVPTAEVTAEREHQRPSPGAGALEGLTVTLPDGRSATAVEHLVGSWGEVFVAMKDGRLVAEWHGAHATPTSPHIIFSMTKSVTGLLAGIAAGEGRLDPEAPVGDYLPVRPGTAYADARVRHLLDMSVGLDFEENYLDRDSAFDRYRRAMLWNPERETDATETMEEVLLDLPPDGRVHGGHFHYASPNTDTLGLVIERATGRRYHEYLAEKLWRPMGATGAAYITVDRVGAARAAGGLCVTGRDMAVLGQLMLDDGVAQGRRIVPAAWLDDIRNNGSRDAWRAGSFGPLFDHGAYRSCWYASGDGHGSLAAIGIHEQWLWIDPVRRVVLVKFSSRPEPSDEAASQREARALAEMARAL